MKYWSSVRDIVIRTNTYLYACWRGSCDTARLPIPNIQTYTAYLIYFTFVPGSSENIIRSLIGWITKTLVNPKISNYFHPMQVRKVKSIRIIDMKMLTNIAQLKKEKFLTSYLFIWVKWCLIFLQMFSRIIIILSLNNLNIKLKWK